MPFCGRTWRARASPRRRRSANVNAERARRMKTVSETEATTRLDAILDEAQREPIAIRRDDRDIAVVVSLKEYERFRELNVQAFLDLRRQVASEAAANRLSEQRI